MANPFSFIMSCMHCTESNRTMLHILLLWHCIANAAVVNFVSILVFTVFGRLFDTQQDSILGSYNVATQRHRWLLFYILNFLLYRQCNVEQKYVMHVWNIRFFKAPFDALLWLILSIHTNYYHLYYLSLCICGH